MFHSKFCQGRRYATRMISTGFILCIWVFASLATTSRRFSSFRSRWRCWRCGSPVTRSESLVSQSTGARDGPLIYVLSYSNETEAIARENFKGDRFISLLLPTTVWFESIVFISMVQKLRIEHAWRSRSYVGFIGYKATSKVPAFVEQIKSVNFSIISELDVLAARGEAIPAIFGGRSA